MDTACLLFPSKAGIKDEVAEVMDGECDMMSELDKIFQEYDQRRSELLGV